MKLTQSELLSSLESTRVIAEFFNKLAHEIDAKDYRHGDDLVKVAKKHKLKIPSVLDGYRIKLDAKPSKLSKNDLRQSIAVELPPKIFTPAKAKSISQCFDVEKGPLTVKVCVRCSISWTSVRCTITITLKASL